MNILNWLPGLLLIPIVLVPKVSMADVIFNGATITNIGQDSVTIEGQNKIVLNEYKAKTPPAIFLNKSSAKTTCTLDKVPTDCLNVKKNLLLVTNGPKEYLFSIHDPSKKAIDIRIQVLPDVFPKYEVAGQSQLAGGLVFAPITGKSLEKTAPGQLIKVNNKGEVVFYRLLNNFTIDFKPHFVGKKTYYSYLVMDDLIFLVGILGTRIILDENFNIVKKIPSHLEFHQFELIDLDHYFSTSIELARTKTGILYSNTNIDEYKNDRLVYRWSVSDLLAEGYYYSQHPRFVKYKGETVTELFHINFFQNLPNEKILISLGVDGIIQIDKRTKKVDWFFGGLNDQFDLPGEKRPLLFHTPVIDLEKSKLLVYLNYNRESKNSALVEYKLDFENKKAIITPVARPQKVESFSMGGFEKYSDDHFGISNGVFWTSGKDYIEQKQNNEVFTIKFIDKKAKGGSKYHAYRFYRDFKD